MVTEVNGAVHGQWRLEKYWAASLDRELYIATEKGEDDRIDPPLFARRGV